MNKNLIGILIVAAGIFFAKDKVLAFIRPETAPASLSQEVRCQGKKMCAVVYVAPWCPACNSLLPNLQGFVKASANHPDYGFQVIVGQGQAIGDNEAKAKEIGEGVITDNNQTYIRGLHVTQFPSFFVVDSNHKITHTGRDAMKWINESFVSKP